MKLGETTTTVKDVLGLPQTSADYTVDSSVKSTTTNNHDQHEPRTVGRVKLLQERTAFTRGQAPLPR